MSYFLKVEIRTMNGKRKKRQRTFDNALSDGDAAEKSRNEIGFILNKFPQGTRGEGRLFKEINLNR